MHFVKRKKEEQVSWLHVKWLCWKQFLLWKVHILIYTLTQKVGNFFFNALTISSMKASVLCHSALQKFPGLQTELRANLILFREHGLFSCGKTDLKWQPWGRKCFKTMSCFTLSRWLKSPSFPKSCVGGRGYVWFKRVGKY